MPATEPRSGGAVVIGGAPCVHDDMEHVPAAFARIGVNHVGRFFECSDIVTAHPDNLALMKARAKGSPRWHTIQAGKMPGHWKEADYVWSGINAGGTSSLIGTRVALAMGYAPVVLAGCPLEAMGHVDGYPAREIRGPLNDATCRTGVMEHWRNCWMRAKAAGELEGVSSLSGWTRDLLGDG